MRISKLRLKNYIGIFEGTGKDLIELDFEPTHTNGYDKILLLGRNGSGKTTILNSLTPFAQNFNVCKDAEQIVKGKPGLKDIEFIWGEKKILCSHMWNSSGATKSFIYETLVADGIDIFNMTPTDREEYLHPTTAKGNVTEFRKVIEEYFGIDHTFLKICRLDNNLSGFIDLPPTKRKEYIGNFMTEIEDWVSMHSNAAKRVTLLNVRLKGLKVELEKIASKEDLYLSKNNLDTMFANETTEHEKCLAADWKVKDRIASCNAERDAIIEQYRSNTALDLTQFNPIGIVAKQLDKQFNDANEKVNAYTAKYPKLKEIVESGITKARITQLNSEIAIETSEKEMYQNQTRTLQSDLSLARNTLSAKQKQIALIGTSEKDAAKLLTELNAVRADLEMLQAKGISLDGIPSDINYTDIKNVRDILSTLKMDILNIKRKVTDFDLFDRSIQTVSIQELERAIEESEIGLKSNAQKIKKVEGYIGEIRGQLAFYNRFSAFHCTDSKCPYEKFLEQFKKIDDELKTKQDSLLSMETTQAELTERISAYKSVKTAIVEANQMYARISQYITIFRMAGVGQYLGSFEKFVGLISMADNDVERCINTGDFYTRIAHKKELDEKNKLLNGILEKQQSLESLVLMKGSIEAELVQIEENLASKESMYANSQKIVEAKTKGVAAKETALRILTELDASIDLRTTCSEELNSFASDLNKLNSIEILFKELKAEEYDISHRVATIKTQLAKHKRELETVTLAVVRREEYESNIESLENSLETTKIIAGACSPAKGIPIKFIDEFINTIKNSANEMLDVAFDGEFRISFEISESEFSIPVMKGTGNTIADITGASDGQKSIAKTVISLALIKHLVDKTRGYNIVCLDEIDGALDEEKNREKFADIVGSFAKKIGLEQIFFITHNDHLRSQDCGLVLLPGHTAMLSPEFMTNKVLIASM